MDPQQYAVTPASVLLDAAEQGFIGVDQRLIHALVDHPERTLPDILRFADSGELEWDLVNIFRYLKPPEAVPYLVGLLRNYRDDPPPDLTETLIEFGSLALDPMLALYGELDEEESSEVAFVLAGLGVRDPRILSMLLDRLEYDAADSAISLSLYGDPAAIPRLEAILSPIPEDDTYLRQELSNAIRDIREQAASEPAPHPPFDIFEQYPEETGPDFDLLDEAGRLSMLAPDIPPAIRAEAASSFRSDMLSNDVRSRLEEAARTDPDANVRGRAWEALASLADEPALRRALLDAARNAPVEERTGAVVALAEGPEVDDDALEVIEPLYEIPAARAKALEAMWKSLDRSFGRYFPRHLDDPDPAVRRQAIMGAGYLELSSQAPRLLQMFNDEEFRHDALLAYALCASVEVTRGRMKPFFRKIDQLAGLSSAEAELVEEALNQRLAMHGLEPVFHADDEDEPEPTAPPKQKLGRNDPCPCGSGKKYKKCCGA